MNLVNYKQEFLDYLKESISITEPKNLFEPIDYILQIGGKRIRPILALLSCKLFNGDKKEAMPAALAIEMFHNFTLLHDDIMDNASIRRGKKTVHEKWNVNTGILSGDAMMILANQYLETYEDSVFKKLMQVFNKTALEVCIGQQDDVDFETTNDVSINQYIHMIKNKTAVLLACSLQMGAIIAKAEEKDLKNIYDFGINLGIAFQLQDDYLDTFGNQETFGKQIGGDITENKKTFLFINLLEKATKTDVDLINEYLKTDSIHREKIKIITNLYSKYNIDYLTTTEIEKYTQLAYESLHKTTLSSKNKNVFIALGNNLLNRVN